MNLDHELKRRNVIRVAAAYIVVGWLVIQVVETILPAFGFGDAAVRYVTVDKFLISPQREAAEAERVATRIQQAREAGRSEALIAHGDWRLRTKTPRNGAATPNTAWPKSSCCAVTMRRRWSVLPMPFKWDGASTGSSITTSSGTRSEMIRAFRPWPHRSTRAWPASVPS
jgi:hypothetical protein